MQAAEVIKACCQQRGGEGGNHQSLLHGQLLSASRRLSHAIADTGNAENLVCFAKYLISLCLAD